MKRVLYVHGGLLNTGGTESVMMNYYRHFDRSELQVDFALHGFGTASYDEEVLSMGGRIFNVVPKGENYLKNSEQLRQIMQSEDYVAVHAHMDTGNAQVLKIAQKCEIPIRISHSHNTDVQTSNPVKRVFNNLEKRKIPKYATAFFACSDLAGEWLYGNNKYILINNAVSTEKFRFSPELRERVGNELGIVQDAPLIGNVGRFSYQKNHERLIEIFCELLETIPNAVLLMIGEGETKEQIQTAVKEKGIDASVIFLPPNQDIYKYMQAMDCLLMPSRFEGLPVVAVEAQASGLPVILSDAVSRKSAITDLVDFVPLDSDNKVWCEAVTAALKKQRTDRCDELREKGFDIVDNAKKMQHFYLTGELLFK